MVFRLKSGTLWASPRINSRAVGHHHRAIAARQISSTFFPIAFPLFLSSDRHSCIFIRESSGPGNPPDLAWVRDAWPGSLGGPALHFGASGLIYGLLAYVFVSGILAAEICGRYLSRLLVGFLYGSMVWGVLPMRPHMSWEMHLSGAMFGVVLAFLYRKWDRTPSCPL